MSKQVRIRRPDLTEATLVLVLLALSIWTLTTQAGISPELESLRTLYGPGRYSQHEEEWIIRDFFRDQRDGFFLDVGANDYRRFSNTFYLEEKLGWSGIAIEPLRRFEAGYVKYRNRTRFFALFVSDVSEDVAKVYVTDRTDLVTSSEKQFTQRWGGNVSEVSVPTITLTDLLSQQRVARIDLLSMDIELHEPKALAGFDIVRFRPRLACIEAHPEVRQSILDYFAVTVT